MESLEHGYLLCRMGEHACGLPLAQVLETLRPQPLTPLPEAAEFVSGVSILRGEAVPIIDCARLLGSATSAPTRLVRVQAGKRRVALLVDAVLGVKRLSHETVAALPPLLDPFGTGAVSALGRLDRELFLVLQCGRLLESLP